MRKSPVLFFRAYFRLRPDDEVDKKLTLCCRYKDQFSQQIRFASPFAKSRHIFLLILALWKALLLAASNVSQRAICYSAILRSLSTRDQLRNDHP